MDNYASARSGGFASLTGSPYAFTAGPDNLGIGVKNETPAKPFSNPIGPLYGPGQAMPVHFLAGAPYAGLNQRDLSTSLNVVTVSHNTIINSLIGNGAYEHGVITLQDLQNVQAATGSNNAG